MVRQNLSFTEMPISSAIVHQPFLNYLMTLRREEQGKGKLFLPLGPVYQFTPRMARMSLFSRRLFMCSSKQEWGQPLSS